MKFRFQVTLTDDDYLEYNNFHMLRSPYGAKTVKSIRFILTFVVIFFILATLISGDFTLGAFVSSIPLFVLLVILQLFLKRYLAFSMKSQIKRMKKKGKMGYSPTSVMEFFGDSFTETTDEQKSELKYSLIERISIVEDKTIYLHTNNVMAYIIPASLFSSKEHYDEFIDFLKTVCGTVDFYK